MNDKRVIASNKVLNALKLKTVNATFIAWIWNISKVLVLKAWSPMEQCAQGVPLGRDWIKEDLTSSVDEHIKTD